jgi:hypothetical protein
MMNLPISYKSVAICKYEVVSIRTDLKLSTGPKESFQAVMAQIENNEKCITQNVISCNLRIRIGSLQRKQIISKICRSFKFRFHVIVSFIINVTSTSVSHRPELNRLIFLLP